MMNAAPATVPAMRPAPTHQTRTEYVQALRRHRGRVVDLAAGVN